MSNQDGNDNGPEVIGESGWSYTMGVEYRTFIGKSDEGYHHKAEFGSYGTGDRSSSESWSQLYPTREQAEEGLIQQLKPFHDELQLRDRAFEGQAVPLTEMADALSSMTSEPDIPDYSQLEERVLEQSSTPRMVEENEWQRDLNHSHRDVGETLDLSRDAFHWHSLALELAEKTSEVSNFGQSSLDDALARMTAGPDHEGLSR